MKIDRNYLIGWINAQLVANDDYDVLGIADAVTAIWPDIFMDICWHTDEEADEHITEIIGDYVGDMDNFWQIVSDHDYVDVGISIDSTQMTRLAEVVDYAARRNISVRAAAVELINSGLSHQQVSV